MDDAQLKELKGNLGLAKKVPLNFAFAPGSGRNESACEMHRKLPPNKLRLSVKKQSGSAKVLCGVASVEGKMLSLTCEEEPPRPLIKALRKFLVEVKLKHKIQILDLAGSVLVADEDDEAADQSDQGAADPSPVATQDTALRDEFAVLSGQAQTSVDQNPDRSDAMLGALKTIEKLSDAGEADKARAGMARLAAALQKQDAAPKSKTDSKGVSASIKKLLKLRVDTDASYQKLKATLAGNADPRISRIATHGRKAVFGGSDGLLDGTESDLFAAVAVWNKSTGEDRIAAEAEIRFCIKQLRTHVEDSTLIRLLEKNPFGEPFQVTGPLVAVLDEIDSQLSH